MIHEVIKFILKIYEFEPHLFLLYDWKVQFFAEIRKFMRNSMIWFKAFVATKFSFQTFLNKSNLKLHARTQNVGKQSL